MRCLKQLTTLVACFKSFGPTNPRNMWTMVDLVFDEQAIQEIVYSSGAIDVDELPDFFPPSLEASKSRATRLGLPNLYDRQVGTRCELHDAIASLCPSVSNLKLIHDLGDGADPRMSHGDLFRKKTIRQLQLVLCVGPHSEEPSIGSEYSTTSVTEIVEALPNLKVLHVTNGDGTHIYFAEFRLSSTSLLCIDWCETGKHNWITSCRCPNLRWLICHAYGYGNGVRPRVDAELSVAAADGEYLAGNTRFDGTLNDGQWTPRPIVFEGLDVPDSCVVSYGTHWL